MSSKTKSFVIVLAAVATLLGGLRWIQSRNQPGGTVTPTPTPRKKITVPPVPTGIKLLDYPLTVGNFTATDFEICKEDNRPVIFYFGSSACPLCRWESPIVKRVMEKFPDRVAFRDNMDNQEDLEAFVKYTNFNGGSIPFLVFGCKYFRTGVNEKVGEVTEEENLTALICKLTGSTPTEVCDPLKEKISEIK